jgi:tetratricopeptide (TPR) repeat protein
VCGEALRVFEQRSAREDVTTRFNLADMRLHSGRWRELQGDPRGALRLYERALAAASSPLLAGGGAETAQQMAQIQLASARARLALRQPSEAREAARTAIRLLSPVARDAEDVYLLETYVEAHSLAARAELALSSAHSDGAACTVLEPAAETARRLRTMTIGLPRPLPGLTEYEAQRAPCGAATPAPVSTQAP